MNADYKNVTAHSLIGSSKQHLFYPVKVGDTLSRIIIQFYGAPYGSKEYQAAIKMIQALNPFIKNPDQIRAGKMLKMPASLTPQQVAGWCEAADDSDDIKRVLTPHVMKPNHQTVPLNPRELDAYSKLAWLTEHYGILTLPAGAALSTIGGLTSRQITESVIDVHRHYYDKEQSLISRNQYNYRRRLAVQSLARRMGPFEKILFQGQTSAEALRIDRIKGMPATQTILQHSARLTRLSKLANHGGIILTGVGLAAGCHQIAATEDRHKKNEIFVETLASGLGGSMLSYGLGILFFSTPMGWATILALGTGAALTSYGIGKGAVSMYNFLGDELDLVNMSGVDSLCH